MKKKILTLNVLLLLIIMSLGGCGIVNEEDAGNANISNNAGTSGSAETQDYTEPPVIELRNTADETDFVTVRPSGYVWTYLEGDGLATGGVADSADPLEEKAPWDILDMTDNVYDVENYTISVLQEPDELMVEAWNITDIGKRSYECPTLEGCIYSREELMADSFSIPIQPGRVYEICLTWNEEKAEENGFYGVVTYTFITRGKVEGEQLTGLDNGEATLEEIAGEVYTEQIDRLEGVQMFVSAVTAEGATVTCTNSTDKEIVFGDDYELQVWDDGKREWHQVKYTIGNWAFDAIGYSLWQEMSLDWDVNWTYFHGSLPPGKYRITKTALDFRGTGDFTEYNLAAEFYILNDEENRELTEANEKAFYEAAESHMA